MKIAIIGAGAIGSTLGALLTRCGEDVTLIGRAAQVAAIHQDGLHVDGQLGSFSVPIKVTERLEFRPDLVLLTVKTQDVLTAIQDNLPYLSDVPLVTLQNGVRSDELVASVLPRSQLLSAVVVVTATYLHPGEVTILERGTLVLGRPFGRGHDVVDLQGEERDSSQLRLGMTNAAPMERIARVLNCGVPTRVSDNIQGAHWLKLLVNLNNALPALINAPASQVARDPYLAPLGVRLVREGLGVIDRAGIRLEGLPRMPVGLFRVLTWLPVGLAVRVLGSMASRFGGGASLLGSTLQSLRRGRPTEIDFLNGEIVRLGQQVGMPTPLNSRVVELVHQVEQTGQFLSADAIRRAMEQSS